GHRAAEPALAGPGCDLGGAGEHARQGSGGVPGEPDPVLGNLLGQVLPAEARPVVPLQLVPQVHRVVVVDQHQRLSHGQLVIGGEHRRVPLYLGQLAQVQHSVDDLPGRWPAHEASATGSASSSLASSRAEVSSVAASTAAQASTVRTNEAGPAATNTCASWLPGLVSDTASSLSMNA